VCEGRRAVEGRPGGWSVQLIVRVAGSAEAWNVDLRNLCYLQLVFRYHPSTSYYNEISLLIHTRMFVGGFL
jgi:hypothetical protein